MRYNRDPFAQLTEIAPWVGHIGLPRGELERRVRAGAEIGDYLADALNVRRSVIRHLFSHASELPRPWDEQPAQLAQSLELLPREFWPSSAEDWADWQRIADELIARGADDAALAVAVPPMLAALQRFRRAGLKRLPSAWRWAATARVLVQLVERAFTNLPSGVLATALARSLLAKRVADPTQLRRAIEQFWREAFDVLLLGGSGSPSRVEPIASEVQAGGLALVPLHDVNMLRTEGAAMHHCLGQYQAHLLLGDGLYFSIRSSGTSLATAEFRLFETVPNVVLVELRAKRNQSLPAPTNGFVRELEALLRQSLSASDIKTYREDCRAALRAQLARKWRRIEKSVIRKQLPTNLLRELTEHELNR